MAKKVKSGTKISTDLEQSLLDEGYLQVIGIDEVGRGCWAGPVVVGAFVYEVKTILIENVIDSKKLTPKRRNLINKELIKSNNYSIGQSSNEEIDQFGIVKAIEKAIKRSLANIDLENSYCLLDGIFKFDLPLPHQTIVKGDNKHYSIAAASIIAKVYRDNLMRDFADKYPEYGFENHFGYGTKAHHQALQNLGPLPIHRKSYKPISKLYS